MSDDRSATSAPLAPAQDSQGSPHFAPGLFGQDEPRPQEDWTELATPEPDYPFAVEKRPRAFRPPGKREKMREFELFSTPPRHWDWREHVALTAPMHQGSCNCCTAFAITTIMTDLATIRSRQPQPPLSPGHLHWCLGGSNCPSALPVGTAISALAATPVALHQNGDYPFNPAACPMAHGVARLRGATSLYTPNDAVRALSAGPIFAVMDLYADFWGSYGGGIYRHRSGNYLNTHSIAIVGYDADTSCWIVKNSEGTGWGEGGYARIAFGECRIFTNGGHGGLMLQLA